MRPVPPPGVRSGCRPRPARRRSAPGGGVGPCGRRLAAANLELVAGHQRPSGRQVLLVLHRHPLQRQLAAAARAACRQPDRDDLVDVLWRVSVGARAVGRAGLAAGALGSGRRVVFGERGGLAFGRSPQRVNLGAQPLVGRLEPIALGPQPIVLPTQPLTFGLPSLLLLSQRGVLVLKPGQAPAQPAQASRIPTSPGTCGHRHHGRAGYSRRTGVKNPAYHSARVPALAPRRAAGRSRTP